MTTIESYPVAAQETEPYPVKRIVGLLFNSFRFSQGIPEMEDEILAYLMFNYGHNFTEEALRKAKPFVMQAVTATVQNPKKHSTEVVNAAGSETIKEQVDRNISTVEIFMEEPRQPGMTDLGSMIIDRDLSYLKKGFNAFPPKSEKDYDGRLNSENRPRDPHENPSANHDPYMSHFVYYGLMEQTTDFAEYDSMFKKITELCTLRATNYNQLPQKIDELVDIYIGHHLKQVSLLPEEYRSRYTQAA